MTLPGVLLLDAAGPEAGALARAAAARRHQVHAATTTTAYADYGPELKGLLAGHIVTDFTRPDRALDEIAAYARRRGVGAVLTVNEYLTELTAHLCAELGVPGNDPGRAHAARDKAAMAETFAVAGVRAPYTVLVRDADGLRAALADPSVGFPCVIKPVAGAGSAGVTVVSGPAGAAAAADAARTVAGMYARGGDPGVLVQAYAAGAEYSVESFTQDGNTTHLAVTRKQVTGGANRVETGHSLPVHLTPVVEAAVYREVKAAIRAAGIRHGASHTEVIVSRDGRCSVIEIGARLAAGQIGVLIQHALGVDVWAALLDVALGRPAALAPTTHGYATVRFVTSPRAGRLASLSGLPRVGPGVPFARWRAAIGGPVHEPHANGHRLGSFVVTGPDAAEVEERADTLLREIRIHVEPHPNGPGQVSEASTSAIAP
ncbi:ATP-grasp domain-containing protein [Streptomyces alkaliterrae]|uniref:ATP-grasp domain-containing protein n=1 Tax=Streptomyces alkaliterrae TaxID=2213162 RepID=A0A5P0YSE4_9ACTN|nr:ATP-grasp domain-containing protein [Streptomyces alkaliterrae]MBB1260927.1 ATP-grasp domain-containing protein [Streptomyces alkaliterrae]MQS03236.1 ATP-grasp domain-containing protein [Streptomyces alkaliterrae]